MVRTPHSVIYAVAMVFFQQKVFRQRHQKYLIGVIPPITANNCQLGNSSQVNKKIGLSLSIDIVSKNNSNFGLIKQQNTCSCYPHHQE